MENERKEYKEKTNYGKQVFYFNDKGQLVVESNKGVWVDGEKFVKMYGDFVCNAKTLGIIIENFKGVPVVVMETKSAMQGYEDDNYPFYKTIAIVNPTDDDKYLKKTVEDLTEQRNLSVESELKCEKENEKFAKSIAAYNRLPWWKRIFKKIEVK